MNSVDDYLFSPSVYPAEYSSLINDSKVTELTVRGRLAVKILIQI